MPRNPTLVNSLGRASGPFLSGGREIGTGEHAQTDLHVNSQTSSSEAECRRVLLSLNPKAGSRSRPTLVENVVAQLRDGGFRVETFSDIDRLAEAATRALHNRELRAVLSAGGDGTVALVANRTPPGTPIALLPLGTENLLAKYIGLPARAGHVCQTIRDGVTQQFDAGEVAGRVFLLMVSCGFDAEVVRRLARVRTGHIRHWSYAKPILDSIRNYQYPELRIYCDDGRPAPFERVEPIRARWVFVANFPRYAGGLRITPEAKGDDGLLDVCTFRDGSFWSSIRYLGGVLLGQHRSWNDCVNVQTPRVRIESDHEVPIQLDGDPGGCLPVEIRVLPGRLTLLVPPRVGVVEVRLRRTACLS